MRASKINMCNEINCSALINVALPALYVKGASFWIAKYDVEQSSTSFSA